ncbi:MAG: GAF domain-containing protein [Candidatus Zixiibacteriota bacterium]|nr:MAG: GAF domain-containing protein [candidate division Zixibacteria bacterium]
MVARKTKNQGRSDNPGRAGPTDTSHEALFRTALSSLPHSFYLIDANDYTVLLDNSRPDPLQPAPRVKCFQVSHRRDHPCSREGESCPLELIRETGRSVTVEHLHYDKNGDERHFEIHGHPVFDDDGRVTSIIEYSLDITNRKKTHEWQQLATRVLDTLNQPSHEIDAIRTILGLVKESTGFEAVGIRLKKGDDYPYYVSAGFPAEFMEAENYLCATNEKGEPIRDADGRPVLECMCGNVIQGRTDPSKPFFTEGGSFWSNNTTQLLATTTEKDRQSRTRNRCNAEGYESVALIPLRSEGRSVGLLQLNDSRPNRFTEEMILFFEGLGASVGAALGRKRAEEALRQAHALLEQRVAERTAELAQTNEQLREEIEFRKKVEEAYLKTSRALKVLSESNKALVRSRSESELLAHVCRILIGTGKYRLAWVGYAEHDEGKRVNPVAQAGFEEGYLETLNITWTDTDRGRGPTGTAIRSGKPRIARNIPTDPMFSPWREQATRRGYASSIALPLKVEKQVIGALNIYASEPDAFDADEVSLLEELANDLAFGIGALRTQQERKRAGQFLRYRLRFEELVANLSTRFINLEADEIGSGIDNALKAIGEFAEVDRSYIFEFSDDGKIMDNTHEWCRDGISSEMDNLKGLKTGDYAWTITRFKRHETVHIPSVAELPRQANAEKKVLQAQAIKSLVMVPMIYGGSPIGFVGFDAVRKSRSWDDDAIALLKIASDMFVSAIVRSRAEKDLHAANEQLLDERKALQEKNIAMREVLARVEEEKQATRRQITLNVEEALLPLMARIKQQAPKDQLRIIGLLEKYLKDIASPFLDTVKSDFSRLTPRELEICHMIKAGQSSKDIAAILNVSVLTIHKHREQIRKKLGLKNSTRNLNSYLQTM